MLIPAHAGKTWPPPSQSGTPRAHPRSRGENAFIISVLKARGGSSPLTRGKHRQILADVISEGLIPAHAGKTPRGWSRTATCRAHPRSRGENTAPVGTRAKRTGSSPLTRGKLGAGGGAQGDGRLIPAHAGKTSSLMRAISVVRAHPRSRGENPPKSWSARKSKGSSPLTRGKPYAGVKAPAGWRLIPAHAGKTRRPPSPAR